MSHAGTRKFGDMRGLANYVMCQIGKHFIFQYISKVY